MHARTKEYRNKRGAHSELGFGRVDFLPSITEFEAIYAFAYGFYSLICGIRGTGPARMPTDVGSSLISIMRDLGVVDPQFDFPGAP